MRALTRRRSNRLLGMLSLCCALTACSGAGSSASPTATAPASQSSGLDVQVVGSDFAVGRNRFTFTLSADNRPITSARPTAYFFSLHGVNALPAGHGPAVFESVGPSTGRPSEITGVYVTHTTFDRAGKWGAEIDFVSNGKKQSLQTIFTVAKHSVTPSVGNAAPRSANPTASQETVSKLDSGRPPDDLHRVSIASAIARHRPLVVLFASAAYCGTYHCGPQISVVQGLERRYRAAVDFVHIDVFRNARPPQLSATAKQWHILSQPWVFVVNRRGRVAAKFEGPAAAPEIEAAIRRVTR